MTQEIFFNEKRSNSFTNKKAISVAALEMRSILF